MNIEAGEAIVFDSPFEFCPVCKSYVLLDQTRLECAREQKCSIPEAECPLKKVFAGIDFSKQAEPKDSTRS